MSEDLTKIYAQLHYELSAAESGQVKGEAFGELSSRECVTAHDILDRLDKAVRARWETTWE